MVIKKTFVIGNIRAIINKKHISIKRYKNGNWKSSVRCEDLPTVGLLIEKCKEYLENKE